jgi:hypothetical protein
VWLAGPRVYGRVGGTRDIPVEALFPQSRKHFELGSSGCSPVLGIDAVGGTPHCDFADKCSARVTSRRSPDRLGVTLAGMVVDLVGEVGDKLGPLCQVASPNRIGMQSCWNAREPGQRTRVGRRERCEAPLQDGRRVVRGSNVASGGSSQQLAKRMLSRFGREGEQAGSKGWPSGFGGESGDVVVGLVELCDGLGSEELFGCDVEAVGVALDRLEKPGRWIVQLAQHSAGGERRFVAGEDLLQRLGRRSR